MIGSPIVFQTAPPQPSSNALATWPYVFVGGPDASQKGFGLWMPAKVVRRSAIGQPFVNLLCGLHTFCRGVDNLRSAIRRSEEHTSELQSRSDIVCRLLLEKKNRNQASQSLDSQLLERNAGLAHSGNVAARDTPE